MGTILTSYVYIWKTLEALIVDLKRKGSVIPKETIDDLKNLKTIINIYNIDSSYSDNLSKIESLLRSIEINLINMAEKDFGKEYADECLRKISEIGKINNIKNIYSSKFVLGIPKGEDWIKIKPANPTEQIEIEKLLDSSGQPYKLQDDGFFTVYGDKQKIKVLVKKIAEKIKKE